MAFDLNPNSSIIAEMFSNPDSKSIALTGDEVSACPRPKAIETTPRIMPEIPRAVRGTEPKIKKDTTESNKPIKDNPKPSKMYELLIDTAKNHHPAV